MSNREQYLINRKNELYNRIFDKLEMNVAIMNGGGNKMKINNGNIIMSDKVLRVHKLPKLKEGIEILANKNKRIHIRDLVERFKGYATE